MTSVAPALINYHPLHPPNTLAFLALYTLDAFDSPTTRFSPPLALFSATCSDHHILAVLTFHLEAAQRPNSRSSIPSITSNKSHIPLATCRRISIPPSEETSLPSASFLAQNFLSRGRPCRQSFLTDYGANFDQQSQRCAADSRLLPALPLFRLPSTQPIPLRV